MPERLISKHCAALGIASALCLAAVPAHAGFQWINPDESAGVQSAPLPPAYAAPPVIIGGSAGKANNSKPAGGMAAADDVISPVIIVGSAPAPAKAEPTTGSSLSFDGVSNDGQKAVSEPTTPVVSKPSRSVVSDSKSVMGSAPSNLGTLSGGDLDMSPAPASTVSAGNPATAVASDASANNGDVVRGFAKSVPLAVALRQILPGGYSFTIDQNVDMGTLVSFKGGRSWRDTLRDSLVPVGLVMREQGQMVTIGYAADRVMTDRVAGVAPSELPPGEMAVAPQSILPGESPMQPASAAPAPLPVRDVSMPSVSSGAHMASAAVPSDVHSRYNWAAERGDSLRKVLAEWSSRVHVEFNWMAEYDYPLEASFGFNGTFEEAVRDLLTGFEGAHPQPVAELHSNPSIGQMVLIVQTRGNTNTD